MDDFTVLTHKTGVIPSVMTTFVVYCITTSGSRGSTSPLWEKNAKMERLSPDPAFFNVL